VLLAAIENLALINQSHGYDAADGLLVDVVKRLRGHLRGTDVIARYNGNKFALVLDGCNRSQMEAAARRLLKAIDAAPIDTPAGPVHLLLRIGAVMDRHGARTPEMLLKRAEAALEAAGESPGRRYAAYLPALADARAQSAQIANDIVAALNERRVLLACQPIVASRDKEPVLYEALMRMRRDDGSLVLPDAVLPVAERTGLIRLIDQRVLELALAKLAENPQLTLAINISATTLHDLDWPARLAQAIALYPGTAERLIIELTETQAINDVAATAQVIAELRALGPRLAMDDFGAGHTSFKNLRQLKVDLLKIDGAFIRNLARSPDDRFFARTLIDLARHVGIPVVAEWVEDEESVRLLTGWGVDYLQGHYFGEASSMEQGFDLRQATGR
jgi:diguanylate cyclase (GGDEF)-like protein